MVELQDTAKCTTADYELKSKARYSRRLDLVRGAYPGAPSALRTGKSIPSSPAPRFSELSAVLRVLDETLAPGSEDATAIAPEGPDLFSLAPRSQPPALGLLTIGLEDREGCSSDVSTEVGYTATLFAATLDLGLGVALVKSSLEGRTFKHKPWGISISSLL